jgi:hypothetical protein
LAWHTFGLPTHKNISFLPLLPGQTASSGLSLYRLFLQPYGQVGENTHQQHQDALILKRFFAASTHEATEHSHESAV